MTRKIAVVFEGNYTNRYGGFNAVINRVVSLRAIADYAIDVYMIQVYDKGLTRLRRESTPASERPAAIEVEGVKIVMWWVERSWLDSLGHRMLGLSPTVMLGRLRALSARLRDYDIVSAHDRLAAHVALEAGRRYGMPVFFSWHGASIYTDPVEDRMIRRCTVELLKSPTCNFFVSEGLVREAHKLTPHFKYEILLNGAPPQFHRYSAVERHRLRSRLGVDDCKVVAYAGRFEPVKNVLWLPDIFHRIALKYDGRVVFWTMGSGWQSDHVKRGFDDSGIDYKMWGKVAPERMPELFNCVDVLVLPSRLEGFPLVTIEALACGANAVAADTVSTAEGIGRDNVFVLDDDFIDNISSRAAEMLARHIDQPLPEACSCAATAKKENEIYQRYLTKLPKNQ